MVDSVGRTPVPPSVVDGDWLVKEREGQTEFDGRIHQQLGEEESRLYERVFEKLAQSVLSTPPPVEENTHTHKTQKSLMQRVRTACSELSGRVSTIFADFVSLLSKVKDVFARVISKQKTVKNASEPVKNASEPVKNAPAHKIIPGVALLPGDPRLNVFEQTPEQVASVEEASVEEASVEEASVEEASVEEALVQEASVEEASVQEASVQEASVQEAPRTIAERRETLRKALAAINLENLTGKTRTKASELYNQIEAFAKDVNLQREPAIGGAEELMRELEALVRGDEVN